MLRKPYYGTGKDVVIVPKGAKNKVMRLAHVSMVAGNFAKDKTLQMIRGRMDGPGIAKDVRAICELPSVSKSFLPPLPGSGQSTLATITHGREPI